MLFHDNNGTRNSTPIREGHVECSYTDHSMEVLLAMGVLRCGPTSAPATLRFLPVVLDCLRATSSFMMNSVVSVVIFLSLFAVVCSEHASIATGHHADVNDETDLEKSEVHGDYYQGNYYLLSLQQCNETAPYTLHGLWPQWGNTCNGPPFSYSDLSPIINEMDAWWPSCYGENDSDFWDHEWGKHGTCSDLSELEYFTTALKLCQNYNYVCQKQVVQKRGVESYLPICQMCFDEKFNKLSECPTK
eukprot:TRINITY_DN10795_c0_g1_i1.p3 TRINITY_DN10795_c0_g1~~TRINITY_DN10795_c0_g1_i1.p3  ORF type:complete len:246 (-),score=31.53 TRINITY_DN10795_c0_g1_i1:983-1720(-)